MGRRPGQELRHVARRLRDPRGVVQKDDLGHAPGGFKSIGGNSEIGARRRLAGGVDKAIIRQQLGKGAIEESLRLHGGEVFAVDPDEIDAAAAALARRLLRQHARDRVCRVRELDLLERDAEVGGHALAGPHDVVVDALAAAPGIEIDGLAPGGCDRARPIDRQRSHHVSPCCLWRSREGEEEQDQQSSHHDASLCLMRMRQ